MVSGFSLIVPPVLLSPLAHLVVVEASNQLASIIAIFTVAFVIPTIINLFVIISPTIIILFAIIILTIIILFVIIIPTIILTIFTITPQVAMLIGVVVLRKRSSRFPSHQVNTFFTKTKTKTRTVTR